MKLIVGLGNPGKKYENTRHNVGFSVVRELARRWEIDVGRNQFQGFFGTGHVAGERIGLLEPMTYMNLSGRSVREAMTFYKLSPTDLLVVCDDLALPLGKPRLRPRGSAGGHNGLASVADEIGGEDFARLRVGIGTVESRDAVGHVLGSFTKAEQETMAQAVDRAADVAETWLNEGVDVAMNRFNRPEV